MTGVAWLECSSESLQAHPATRSDCPSVGGLGSQSVCHNFLKGRKVTLPCFYWSTCYVYGYLENKCNSIMGPSSCRLAMFDLQYVHTLGIPWNHICYCSEFFKISLSILFPLMDGCPYMSERDRRDFKFTILRITTIVIVCRGYVMKSGLVLSKNTFFLFGWVRLRPCWD